MRYVSPPYLLALTKAHKSSFLQSYKNKLAAPMNGHAEQGMRAKVNIPLLIACYSCGGTLLSVPSVIWDIFPVSAYGTFKYTFFFSLSSRAQTPSLTGAGCCEV